MVLMLDSTTDLPHDKKTCSSCGSLKLIDDFYLRSSSSDGRQSLCKPCDKERHRKYWAKNKKRLLANAKKSRERNLDKIKEQARRRRQDNPHKFRGYMLKHRYGISGEEYDGMLISQGLKCAICASHEAVLNVDHCHKSGDVRGLLCRKCNVGIGSFDDRIDLLLAAIRYLRGQK